MFALFFTFNDILTGVLDPESQGSALDFGRLVRMRIQIQEGKNYPQK